MVRRYSRAGLEQWFRFLKLHILRANDSPHRIALGAALGLFVAFLPAIGFQVLLVLALCIILRANKLAAVIFVWVSNPFTIVPVYYPSYLLGRAVLKFFHYSSNTQLPSGQILQTFEQFDLVSSITNLFSISFWQNLFSFFWHKGFELWIGATLIGLFIAITGYFAAFYIITWHRKKNPRRRFQIGRNS